MSNDYFQFDTGRLIAGEPALAEDVNSVFDSIVVGFEQLPGKDALRFGTASYVVATGPANVYALDLDATAYSDGMLVTFKASAANTGSCSLNVNGLGAKSLVSIGGTSLVVGDILSGSIYTARYNVTSGKFELQGLTSGSMGDVATVSTNITDIITIADNLPDILAAEGHASDALDSANAAAGSASDASDSADAAAISAANLPNASTAGADKVITTDGAGTGWTYRTAAQARTFIGADNGDNITSGTIADARIASTICRDSELAAHTGDTSNPHTVTKTQVGLGNCDNTTDANKPVSSATQSALDGKEASLGNPSTNGQVLSSTTGGTRSWTTVSMGPLAVQVFTSSGTYTKTLGATVAVVEVVGGGGSGGGSGSGLNSAGGGGAGGYTKERISLAAVTTETVTVGTGGAAVSGNTTGNTGNTSSFGSHCSATGGAGGVPNYGGGGVGGVGSGGHVNAYGGSGDRGLSGGGGSSFFGGGRGYNSTSGGAPGAGGWGAVETGSTTSGAGMNGIVIVTEY